MSDDPTLAGCARALADGTVTSRQLVERCLDRIATADSGGRRAFLSVASDRARREADAVDAARGRGETLPPMAGVPISIKDLFDVAGEVTTAGSRALEGAPPAQKDATAIARLKAAGFILIGRTNMTEFAYSGLGLNPHFGTPVLLDEGADSRIPGGSSSGAAVSVRLGMAHGAIGTDTGGSCRIPAAFCGLAGFKPTAARIPRDGCVPLSLSLDSIGAIARSAACCATLDAVMAGDADTRLPEVELAGLRFAVPETSVLDDLDPEIERAFHAALDMLSRAGVRIMPERMAEFSEVETMNAGGGFSAIESWSWHRRLLATRAGDYDPRILELIGRGEGVSAADYLDLCGARASFIDRVTGTLRGYDAMLMVTVPGGPPRLSELDDPAAWRRENRRALRNSFVVNMYDGCALAITIQPPGCAPFSLTLAGTHGTDRAILAIGAAVETAFTPRASALPPLSAPRPANGSRGGRVPAKDPIS